MAEFLKCDDEIATYKTLKKQIKSTMTVPYLIFWSKTIVEYEDVFDRENIRENEAINIELVLSFQKTIGLHDRSGDNGFVFGTQKYGICFSFNRGEVTWYYSSIEARDKQYEEIIKKSKK